MAPMINNVLKITSNDNKENSWQYVLKHKSKRRVNRKINEGINEYL